MEINLPMMEPKYRIECSHWNLGHVSVKITTNPTVNVVVDWKCQIGVEKMSIKETYYTRD
jgi:hypothetical protein